MSEPVTFAAVKKRGIELESWLYQEAAEVFKNQGHLDETVEGKPTEERKYWHYGYMMALRDISGLEQRVRELRDKYRKGIMRYSKDIADALTALLGDEPKP